MKNPAANASSLFSLIFNTSTLAMVDYSSGPFHNTTQPNTFQTSGVSVKKMKKFFKRSPYFPLIIVMVIVVLIVGMLISKAMSKTDGVNAPAATVKQANVAKPLAQETLNKVFNFPLKNVNGKEVSKIQYEIQSVEFDNQIIIKGQEATSVKGKTFLILNLKITNNYDKPVELNTRDYIRLIVDNASDKLAADIHNDPVDVQAISTKYTRLGFPVDINAKSLILQVGEIDGTKQTIQLNLK